MLDLFSQKWLIYLETFCIKNKAACNCSYFTNHQKLKVQMLVYNVGLNWIMNGENLKLSLDYQSRPIFNTGSDGDIRETKNARRDQVVLQYQVAF